MLLLAGVLAAPAAARLWAGAGQSGSGQSGSALTVQITSPLGRTGMTGPIRIVARVEFESGAVLSPVQFFVDGKLVGSDTDGAPFAVEWLDDNPYESREIVVTVADSRGRTARDSIVLRPLEFVDSAQVSSVFLEPSVIDKTGRRVNGLTAADFVILEDGVRQTIEVAIPDAVSATYTLLIDGSQSMQRRMDFVRDAARRLPDHLRPDDQVIVAPFTISVGPITGPTRDHDTIAGAIDQIQAAGGTAILNALVTAADKLRAIETRHVLVLITDGYDEKSDVAYARALEAVKATETTVYIIGVGGTAGISLRGEALLRQLAAETGGRAFFPVRDFQLADVHGLIAADVQQRYVVTYTPTNQAQDGTWRAVSLTTHNPSHVIRVRAGYFASAPPPIRPQIELTVRDVQRQPVDIDMADLIVTEDGVEQTIEAFQEATAPVSVVLVLDSSGSMKRDAAAVMEAARSFVAALPAKDSLGVMTFADRPILAHDLSTNRDSALRAIGTYTAVGGTALYDALGESFLRLQRVKVGRRVVVVLTDGRDEDNPGTAPGSTRTLPDVLALMKEVGATVFGIGLGPKVDRGTIEHIAQASGGESYFPQDVSLLAADYRRVLEDLRRRFVISYTSTNSKHDGGWRVVEVRSRREGVIITSQGGYRAPEK
jgi:Ca-activated chloride channel family protein